MILFPRDLILEDERARLRLLRKEDFEFLLPFAEAEPDLWQYSTASAAGRDGMICYLDQAFREYQLQKEYPFIVFDKQANAYAGSTRFYDIQLNHLTTQLGYTWYGKRFQQTGLNRHCKQLLLTYAFEQWGMERVEFRADLKNDRSIQSMKKLGCTPEGVLRSNKTCPEGRRDSIVLSILKTEWLSTVKQTLSQKTR
ncbi:MAG: GNAT family protein [Bacteroidota bacterium]|nr:GNAT family protein [Bacteroidota bacterium]MDP4212571.1 GNAT family protein [Bacteroidota bacterium]MDP4249879.1 GNAT family protein [Bacteroidota bacterium]